jgi:hypothetical protein
MLALFALVASHPAEPTLAEVDAHAHAHATHVLDADEPGKWCPAAPATVNASLPWALSPAEAAALAKEWRCPDRDAFARELVPWALARHPMCGESSCFTPLSHYRCFAVMTGAGGAIYFGVNIEVRVRARDDAPRGAVCVAARRGHRRAHLA